jgi:hypothetical protein
VLLYRVGWTKIIDFILIYVLFFLIEMKCFNFRVFRRTVSGLYCLYIYIYSTNIIQIQDKLIINYTIQTKYQNIMKVKYFNTNILNIKLGQCYQS